MLIGHDAKPICFKCGTELKRDFPAPKGYVKGTHNPVKQ